MSLADTPPTAPHFRSRLMSAVRAARLDRPAPLRLLATTTVRVTATVRTHGQAPRQITVAIPADTPAARVRLEVRAQLLDDPSLRCAAIDSITLLQPA